MCTSDVHKVQTELDAGSLDTSVLVEKQVW